MKKLYEYAKVVRTKNAGPFEITFDVLFKDEESYKKVKNSGALTEENILKLYHLRKEDLVTLMFYEPALAFKFTAKRPASIPQGSVGERDTFGAQQHVPLMYVDIP